MDVKEKRGRREAAQLLEMLLRSQAIRGQIFGAGHRGEKAGQWDGGG